MHLADKIDQRIILSQRVCEHNLQIREQWPEHTNIWLVLMMFCIKQEEEGLNQIESTQVKKDLRVVISSVAWTDHETIYLKFHVKYKKSADDGGRILGAVAIFTWKPALCCCNYSTRKDR